MSVPARSRMLGVALSFALVCGFASGAAAQVSPDAGMLRYPDVSATHIAFLYGDLHKQIEAIDERLVTLNTALQALDYTPSTYIQLQAEPTRDAEVRAFREQLQACLPDVAATLTSEDYETSFQRIQELITRFQEDTRWTGKVCDVRHWLDFAASERYRSNNQ